MKLSSQKTASSNFHLDDGDLIINDPNLILSNYIFSQPNGDKGVILKTRNKVSVGILRKDGSIKARAFRKETFDKLDTNHSFIKMIFGRWPRSLSFPFSIVGWTYLLYLSFCVLVNKLPVSGDGIQGLTILMVFLGFIATKCLVDPSVLRLNGATHMLMNAICDIRYIKGEHRELSLKDFPHISKRKVFDYLNTDSSKVNTIGLIYALLLIDGRTQIGMAFSLFLGLCIIPIALHTIYFYGNESIQKLAKILILPQWFWANNPRMQELSTCIEAYNAL